MRYEYGLAFFCGVVVMALANALSLGLLPCRALAVIFLLVALAAVRVPVRAEELPEAGAVPLIPRGRSQGTGNRTGRKAVGDTEVPGE